MWLDRLIGLLERELALVNEMRELLAQERQAIVANDTSSLLKIAKKKETLGMKQKILEEARLSCLKNAGKEGYTVSQLMEELAPRERERLQDVCSRLKTSVERLMWENKRNALLINKAMELNNELYRIFSSAYGLSYGPDGSLSADFQNGNITLRG